ncbi:SDR family oxidoreductase [Novosphingobium sp. G106]|uniref:SDR family oxidoreductase n=1 Tax=Novosphingobium sp. G106 TaxID=2849500 RepID=UPI001C2D4CAE|nr:SDR family oxidoreductase [Novosphingobium sp. G106]MBV1686147.1 SDR family oxidoreductase [Novosphingobium sp. G106]
MGDHIAGKSVIITGAGSGFGKLTAEKLGAEGARLTCLDIDGNAAETTAAAIRAGGGEAQAFVADVTSIDDMRRAAATTITAYGAIDVMVNNAGTMPLAFIADHAAALPAWSRCIDINFKGVMHGSIAVYDQMMAQGRGHIVNLSSIYGNRPSAGAAVYGATKAAVDYFSHALRQEARGRIKVTVIKPTGVMATALMGTVVNQAAGVGIMGHNVASFYEDYGKLKGDAPGALADPENIGYAFLTPEHIADAIVHTVNQPWGISISDITVRASGEHYIA